MTIVAPQLNSLPLEILLDISQHLTAFELIRLSRTCRSLRRLGECKNFAIVLMRQGSAEEAIINIIYRNLSAINRMDLVVELFRHVKDRKNFYPFVAELAGRLNDVAQLEVWRAEFGFIPPETFKGAAQSDRIETFEYIASHAKLDNGKTDSVFENIGQVGNRALLDHLQSKYPAKVTPERLEKAIKSAATRRQFDFARYVFRRLATRNDAAPGNFGQRHINDKRITSCARHIINMAAACGNINVFSAFIDMFEFAQIAKEDIATSAATSNHVTILRVQEASINRAELLDQALMYSIDHNSVDAFRHILDMEEREGDRVSMEYKIDAFMLAVRKQRSEMVSRLMKHVPRRLLPHGAVACASFDDAVMLLKEYQRPKRESIKARFCTEYDFDEYTADVPDWKMTVWLVVIGLDEIARTAKTDIEDDERARYLSVLANAIDLARELNMGNVTIDGMTKFARRQM